MLMQKNENIKILNINLLPSCNDDAKLEPFDSCNRIEIIHEPAVEKISNKKRNKAKELFLRFCETNNSPQPIKNPPKTKIVTPYADVLKRFFDPKRPFAYFTKHMIHHLLVALLTSEICDFLARYISGAEKKRRKLLLRLLFALYTGNLSAIYKILKPAFLIGLVGTIFSKCTNTYDVSSFLCILVILTTRLTDWGQEILPSLPLFKDLLANETVALIQTALDKLNFDPIQYRKYGAAAYNFTEISMVELNKLKSLFRPEDFSMLIKCINLAQESKFFELIEYLVEVDFTNFENQWFNFYFSKLIRDLDLFVPVQFWSLI